MSSIEEASDDSDELYEHFKIEVDPGQALLRIDKFLMDRIPDISRSRLQAAAKAEALLVNDKPVKSNYKVKPSDVIQLLLPFQKHFPSLQFPKTPQHFPTPSYWVSGEILEK